MDIDLHIHSRNSDGEDTVGELVPLIAKSGLDVFALTDHDRTDGWAEARQLAGEFGLSFIPGVEVTAEGRFSELPFGIHLLAYLPNPNHAGFSAMLETNLNQRIIRMRKFLQNLQADYPELTYELVTEIAQEGSTLGRPDIAAGLVKLGVFGSVDQVFQSGVLSKFSKHYVRNEAPDVLEVIKTVRAAGGVPVIAHPLARTSKEDKQPANFPREHFEKMVEAGLLGIETNHLEVPNEVREVLESFAVEFNLLTTGSSDYHGLGTKSNNPLGLRKTKPEELRKIIELGTGTEPLLNHAI